MKTFRGRTQSGTPFEVRLIKPRRGTTAKRVVLTTTEPETFNFFQRGGLRYDISFDKLPAELRRGCPDLK